MSLITVIPESDRPLPTGDTAVMAAIYNLIDTLRRSKPNDRTERDRWYAICITDAEKLDAIFHSQVIVKENYDNAAA